MSEQPDKKFDDCDLCRFFSRRWGHIGSICRICTIGEFFQEKINDGPPDDDELMRMYARMPKDE